MSQSLGWLLYTWSSRSTILTSGGPFVKTLFIIKPSVYYLLAFSRLWLPSPQDLDIDEQEQQLCSLAPEHNDHASCSLVRERRTVFIFPIARRWQKVNAYRGLAFWNLYHLSQFVAPVRLWQQPPPKTFFPMALWETSHYVSNRLLMSLYRRAMVETVSPALFEERRQKKTFPKLFTKPLVLRFATVASIARISSGRGAASWKSWEQLKSSFDCKEGVLSHPLTSSARPVPEVLVLRPLRVINHSDLFSCQYQQKDPKPNKDVFNKRVFSPLLKEGQI